MFPSITTSLLQFLLMLIQHHIDMYRIVERLVSLSSKVFSNIKTGKERRKKERKKQQHTHKRNQTFNSVPYYCTGAMQK